MKTLRYDLLFHFFLLIVKEPTFFLTFFFTAYDIAEPRDVLLKCYFQFESSGFKTDPLLTSVDFKTVMY